MFGKFIPFKRLAKKVWQMNRSAKGLLMVTTNLDGFSLANCRRFTKLSTRQTFPLYGSWKCCWLGIDRNCLFRFIDSETPRHNRYNFVTMNVYYKSSYGEQ